VIQYQTFFSFSYYWDFQKKNDLTNSEGPVVTKEAVLSVLRDPDFKNELNKMISSLIHNEFAKLFDNLKAELSPYVYKAGINLKKLVEREFPGGELTQWKYFDQKGIFWEKCFIFS
jgi:hypothetical protein